MGAGGNISSITFNFNHRTLNIRSQSLINCVVDICFENSDVDTFNRVNETMFNFNKGMFNPNYKSLSQG